MATSAFLGVLGVSAVNGFDFELSLQSLQKRLGLLQLRKQILLRLKFGGMYAAPAAALLDRMLQVQHLVVEDVLEGVARHLGMIEDAADDNSIVCRIVMSQAAAGALLAPAEQRTRHQAVEKAPVEVFKNFFQMIGKAARRLKFLPAAQLAHLVGLVGDFVA